MDGRRKMKGWDCRMDKRPFVTSEPLTSLLGMGCMRLPLDQEGSIDDMAAMEMIDYLYEAGVNYFDTAWMYHNGTSEAFVRRALVERYPRDSFRIADKLPVWEVKTQADAERIFETQRERLGVEMIDFYLLHALDGQRWQRAKELKLYEYQQKLKKEGKVQYIGFSYHGATQDLRKILMESDYDFVQLQINYYDWNDYACDQYELTTEFGIPVIVMEPVRGGTLAKPPSEAADILSELLDRNSPSQLALRWVAGRPNVKLVLSGMSTLEQAKENVESFSPFVPLDETQLAVMARVRQVIAARPTIPCTACNYCKDCPEGINIPQVFAAYNEYGTFDNVESARWQYLFNLEKERQADRCTGCRTCVENCPQSIDIPKEFERVLDCFRAVGIIPATTDTARI